MFADICGYIFKARSPSCGIEGVATWTEQGSRIESDGTGAFAEALLSAHPELPVTDEARLQDLFFSPSYCRISSFHPPTAGSLLFTLLV